MGQGNSQNMLEALGVRYVCGTEEGIGVDKSQNMTGAEREGESLKLSCYGCVMKSPQIKFLKVARPFSRSQFGLSFLTVAQGFAIFFSRWEAGLFSHVVYEFSQGRSNFLKVDKLRDFLKM